MATSNDGKVASLEDRITMPDNKDPISTATKDKATKAAGSEAMSATAPTFGPDQPGSWADEVVSPPDANPPATNLTKGRDTEDDLANAQTDGATEALNGTQGVYEPSYSVDVKLNDIQADPNNPLYSVKSFEELNL